MFSIWYEMNCIEQHIQHTHTHTKTDGNVCNSNKEKSALGLLHCNILICGIKLCCDYYAMGNNSHVLHTANIRSSKKVANGCQRLPMVANDYRQTQYSTFMGAIRCCRPFSLCIPHFALYWSIPMYFLPSLILFLPSLTPSSSSSQFCVNLSPIAYESPCAICDLLKVVFIKYCPTS